MKLFITTMPRQEVYWLQKDKKTVIDDNGNKVRDPMGYIPVDCDHLQFGKQRCLVQITADLSPLVFLMTFKHISPNKEARIPWKTI